MSLPLRPAALPSVEMRVRPLSASPAALKEQWERRVRCFVRPRVSMGFLLFNKVSCCELEY